MSVLRLGGTGARLSRQRLGHLGCALSAARGKAAPVTAAGAGPQDLKRLGGRGPVIAQHRPLGLSERRVFPGRQPHKGPPVPRPLRGPVRMKCGR